MRTRVQHIDRTFLFLVIILVILGFFIFLSASLGLLAREGEIFSKVATKQLLYGLFLGIPAFFVGLRVPPELWKRVALPLFLGALLLTVLTFVPHIGFATKGAHRWITILGFSFQPAEFLKLGIVFYLSLWYTNVRTKITEVRYGIMPLVYILGLPALLLVLQPDNDTVLTLIVTAVAIFLVAGGRWRHLFVPGIGLLLALVFVASTRPYVRNRVMTFLDPTSDPLGASYQVRQALIAVGSGELMGKGFGQSIQKFNYLPEPVSDSIFAVAAEEFGFVGSVTILLLFVAFTLRGLWIAARAPDSFTMLVTTGFVILIATQSLMNIGAMLGLVPLSGQPLIFISQGGTALVFSLFEVGMILSISRRRLVEES